MKRIVFLVFFVLVSMALKAQLDAQFTLFPWASSYYNPGAVGMQNNTLCFTGIFANQNTAFRTTPDENGNTPPSEVFEGIRDYLVNAEFYSRKIRGAIGLSFLNDEIQAEHNIAVRLGYTYRMKLGGGDFGVGFQANLFNQTNKSWVWIPGEEGDPDVDKLRNKSMSKMFLDFNLGLHYRAETWEVGASVVNLLGTDVSITLSGEENSKLARQLYIHGGYIWTLPNPSWTLEPKALIKTDFSTVQLDLLVLARYNGILWTGASYRIDDAVSVMFGARPFYNSSNNYVKGLDIGIAYGFDTKRFAYKSGGGSFGQIEVMLRYCFDLYKTETFTGYGSTRAIYKNQY